MTCGLTDMIPLSILKTVTHHNALVCSVGLSATLLALMSLMMWEEGEEYQGKIMMW